MCGIVGIVNLKRRSPPQEMALRQMLALIRHRGPDQFGIYLDDSIGLGSARLSILDLNSGQQPISNEDGSLWIVFNGEIFNYRELRSELEAQGHSFQTQSDTEVIVHLYEQLGTACLSRLNGQFALAIWDVRRETLFLGRDRLGVRPLFYTVIDDTLIFASEIKSILADARVRAEIDPVALDQTFTYWSPLSPGTIFKNIQALPPGHNLLAHSGEIIVKPYWTVQFSEAFSRDLPETLNEFRELLIDATRIRLHADVPVGAYLSGGLDSSTLAAVIRNYTHTPLTTFSIAFGDPTYDESVYQRQMANVLGTDHHVVQITHADIGNVFPEVIWHTEAPILRTAPAPMFLLSKLVQSHGFKVVLTGEGADEFLVGYDIFKEAKIRQFWARHPSSSLRPLLLRRLYPHIPSLNGSAYLASFFGQGLTDTERFDYSHRLRWNTTARAKRFFAAELRHTLDQKHETSQVYTPAEFAGWDSLQRAQYLEISIFLSGYLLSSQGDRMAMAHSVEGRFPFLDHRVVEFCNRLPSSLKLRGLTEKFLLRKLAQEWLPDDIWRRPKQPYRAPIHHSFFSAATPDYVRELLSPQAIKAAGFFDTSVVSHLVRKIEQGLPISEGDDMALAGILSTQLIQRQFVEHFEMPAPVSGDIKLCTGLRVAEEA